MEVCKFWYATMYDPPLNLQPVTISMQAARIKALFKFNKVVNVGNHGVQASAIPSLQKDVIVEKGLDYQSVANFASPNTYMAS